MQRTPGDWRRRGCIVVVCKKKTFLSICMFSYIVFPNVVFVIIVYIHEAVTVGAFVLADTTILADLSDNNFQECARGIILACDYNRVCRIGFMNKNQDWLTTLTLTLPDQRILQPILNEDDASDLDSWSRSESSG